MRGRFHVEQLDQLFCVRSDSNWDKFTFRRFHPRFGASKIVEQIFNLPGNIQSGPTCEFSAPQSTRTDLIKLDLPIALPLNEVHFHVGESLRDSQIAEILLRSPSRRDGATCFIERIGFKGPARLSCRTGLLLWIR